MSTRNLAPSAVPAVFPWRSVTLACLAAAGIIAVASLAGPTWLVRVGSIVGLAAGVVAAVLAVRAMRRLDEGHRTAAGEQVINLERTHGDQLRAHRSKDAGVADALRGQLRSNDATNQRLRARIARADDIIGTQRATLDSLHAECGELRRKVDARDETIAGLRTTVAAHEEELAALLGDVEAAEVYTMPRRVRSAERAAAPENNELVDLATAQTAAPAHDTEVRKQA